MFRPCRILFFFLSRTWHWWLQSWRLSLIFQSKVFKLGVDWWLTLWWNSVDQEMLSYELVPEGVRKMRYQLQLQMWGRVKNVSKENVFLHSSKLVVFLLCPMKSGKSGDWWRKKNRSDAMFRRIDPVPSFFSFPVNKLYFKLTSSTSNGSQIF